MRLLTYNIHKGIGGRDRRYRLERILETIEAQNPDIICLQEVDRDVRRSRFDDQPRLFASRFRSFSWFYQFNVHLRRGGYGNLVLCRWPFHSRHRISLTLGRKKARGAQLLGIDTPEGRMHLVNWHLGLAERERQWQVNHLLKHRLFREAEDLPTMIAGDFNDWRNTLHRAVFNEHGFRHVTTPPSRFRSFPAWMPVGSLDKAFVRGDIKVTSSHVVRTRLAKEASDHLPLLVDFHLDSEEEA